MKRPLQTVNGEITAKTAEFDHYGKWNISHIQARKEKPPLFVAEIFTRAFAYLEVATNNQNVTGAFPWYDRKLTV
jgi:hypothetical protein